jgi:drug/metabolite transporter (DMT)-like permease
MRRSPKTRSTWIIRGAFYAAGAAALFGASTPAAKVLLGSVPPSLLAGLLYLGSGIGLLCLWLARRRTAVETPIARRDLWWLAGATLFGGIIGPVLLMFGLARTAAATASLLLNVEGIATALIAWLAFREHASRRTVFGMFLILLGAIMLSWQGHATVVNFIGPLAIAGACIAWAIDNNLTRNIAGSDAVQIAAIKSLVAGAVNTLLAIVFAHANLPSAGTVLAAAAVGFVGYGLSLVLYILGLRELGTARTGAYFSTAPFIGAAMSVAIGSAVVDTRFVFAAVLMFAGVWLHVTERHEHEHMHEAVEHEHSHVHDAHHQHEHSPGDPLGEPHSHRHKHTPLTHAHAHFPDEHHRHAH